MMLEVGVYDGLLCISIYVDIDAANTAGVNGDFSSKWMALDSTTAVRNIV